MSLSALSAVLSTRVGRLRKFKEFSCTECIGQGNDFELNSTVDVLCSNFVKFGRLEISEILRSLRDKKKQNFAWLSSYRYCVDRVQNLPGPATDNAPDFI